MEQLYEILQASSPFVYGGLALAAFLQWHRRRGAAAAWLAATFSCLAFVVIVGRFLPEGSASGVVELIRRIDIAILVLFPYFLWRFHLSFMEPVPWVWVVAHALTGGVILGSFFVDVTPGAARTLGTQLWIYLLLIQWTFLSMRVAVRLWRAGMGQPSVARRRMQLLGAGATMLALALLLAGLAPSEGDEVTGVQVATQLFGFGSAGLFLMGFAPPGFVRAAWRRPEEERLRQAELGLMSADTPTEVAQVLLPHVVRLVGGSCAVLLERDFTVIASDGDGREVEEVVIAVREDPTEGVSHGGRIIVVRLEVGWLAVVPSRYSPFFGREETDLFHNLALLADLALSRTNLIQDLARSNAELEQFAYVASHDLQEPLRTVASYAELFSNRFEGELDDKADKYIHYMVEGCSRMQTLINDLLEFSRVGTRGRQLTTVDSRAALDKALGNIESAIRDAKAKLEIGDLPSVDADEAQLIQLFQNLVGNSIKYRHPDRPPEVVVSAQAQGEREWMFSIQDNGIGIDPKYEDRIFTIFQRLHTRQEYPGTGIGLAICRKIVERHGGRIWLDPSSASGAAFRFTLPAGGTSS